MNEAREAELDRMREAMVEFDRKIEIVNDILMDAYPGAKSNEDRRAVAFRIVNALRWVPRDQP